MKREIRRIVRDLLVNSLASSIVIPSRWRWRVYAALGLGLDRCYIAPRVFFGGRKVEIGRNSFLNYGCFIDTSAQVAIGSRVSIGMGTHIITGSHEIGPASQRAGVDVARAVTIGDGTWVGAGVTILPGVLLGEGCVVGAGALVTRSWPAHSRIAGVPAKSLATADPSDEDCD